MGSQCNLNIASVPGLEPILQQSALFVFYKLHIPVGQIINCYNNLSVKKQDYVSTLGMPPKINISLGS